MVLVNSLSCCSAEVLSLDSADRARTGCYTAQSPFYLGLESSMSYLSFLSCTEKVLSHSVILRKGSPSLPLALGWLRLCPVFLLI